MEVLQEFVESELCIWIDHFDFIICFETFYLGTMKLITINMMSV